MTSTCILCGTIQAKHFGGTGACPMEGWPYYSHENVFTPAEPSTEGTQAAQPKVVRFRNGMRVKVTDHGGRSDMNGLIGHVVRIKTSGHSAWVKSDTPLSVAQRRFPAGDDREDHFDIYDDECEEVPAPAAQVDAPLICGHCGKRLTGGIQACSNGGTCSLEGQPAVAQVDARARVLAAYPDAYQIETGFIITPLICGREVPNDCIGCSWEDAASNLPAVAQVDAGKCYLCGTSPICEDGRCFACRLEERTQADVIAADAQTELPPIPLYESWPENPLSTKYGKMFEDSCGTWVRYSDHKERIASLTQRLQEQEAEIAEVKVERNTYDSAHKQQAVKTLELKAQLTALQVSHDALLDAVKNAYNPKPDKPTLRGDLEMIVANAEKLRGK